MTTKNDLEALLARGAMKVGMELDGGVLDKLMAYLGGLEKWNQRINLVGTRDVQQMAVQHVIDSVAVVPHLPAGPIRVVDVGSGAGLPGVVVAAVRADVQVTSLEPIHKKHAFQAAMRRELRLDNLRPLAQRLEEHLGAPGFQPYEVAMSRATFAVPAWIARARPLVRQGGLILAMEGAEQHELPAGGQRRPYELHGAKEERVRAILVVPVGYSQVASES